MEGFREVLPLHYQAFEGSAALEMLYLSPLLSTLAAHLTRGCHGAPFQTPGPAVVLTKLLFQGHLLGTCPDGPQLLSSIFLAFIFHYSIQAIPPPRVSDFKTLSSPFARPIVRISSSSCPP